VDNWFALSVNGQSIAEDSTPYLTERSFNAEKITFNADFPMTVAIELRDFMENDTGLEYIGTNRQQMGDGGAIVQFSVGGQVVGVSNAGWRCHVAQAAPMNTSCAKESNPQVGVGACASTSDMPADWTSVGFDDSGWAAATVHSESEVSPKMGYDAIDWDRSADLIWAENLKQDNIVLCRTTIQ